MWSNLRVRDGDRRAEVSILVNWPIFRADQYPLKAEANSFERILDDLFSEILITGFVLFERKLRGQGAVTSNSIKYSTVGAMLWPWKGEKKLNIQL